MPQYLSVFKNPSWDVVLLLAILAGGFFWGTFSPGGKRKISSVILSLYVLNVIFPFIPLGSGVATLRAGVFVALLILITLFLLRALKGMGGGGSWWEVLALVILMAGFLAVSLLAILHTGPAKNSMLTLSPLVNNLFGSRILVSFWTIAPLVGVLFI